MNDYLTFAEVAGELGCTLKEVRTLVVENKTLRATRITRNGLVLDACGPEGHFPYDLDFCCHLDDNGEITSDVYGGDSTGQTVLLKTLDVGALRVERTDLENFRIEHPARPAPDSALEVPKTNEQLQDNHGSAQTTPVPAITVSTAGGVEQMPAGEPKGNVATSPVFSMTRAALVAAHGHHWPTINGDLKDANKNGLASAKAGLRDWIEHNALLWAKSKGKLITEDASGTTQAMHRMGSLPSRTHTQKV